MTEPHVPGQSGGPITLPCGESIRLDALDLGMRAWGCGCGAEHAVVMDVHPLSRWIPESVETVLRETIDTADEFDAFGTVHLMGLVLEEYPDAVAAVDVSDHDALGASVVWITEMDPRRLHEIIVELLVELMDHAMSHADDETAQADFQASMRTFDIEAFVESYRADREFSDETDYAV